MQNPGAVLFCETAEFAERFGINLHCLLDFGFGLIYVGICSTIYYVLMLFNDAEKLTIIGDIKLRQVKNLERNSAFAAFGGNVASQHTAASENSYFVG
jgi:hypothetical protein